MHATTGLLSVRRSHSKDRSPTARRAPDRSETGFGRHCLSLQVLASRRGVDLCTAGSRRDQSQDGQGRCDRLLDVSRRLLHPRCAELREGGSGRSKGPSVGSGGLAMSVSPAYSARVALRGAVGAARTFHRSEAKASTILCSNWLPASRLSSSPASTTLIRGR
jgi:hypothetical protein